MASPSSPEYRAITKNIASISTAFSSSGILPWLAEKLFEADFISEQLCSDICSTLGVNNYTKSSNLMQCVMRRIKQNPSKYYTFIAILEEQPSLIDIVNSIQVELNTTNSTSHTISRLGFSAGKPTKYKWICWRIILVCCTGVVLAVLIKQWSSVEYIFQRLMGVDVAAKPSPMNLSAKHPRTVQTSLNKYNINITENYGLNTGYWWLRFTFDYALEKGIEVRLTNFKYSDRCDWTLEVVKCTYLGIESKEQMASFDMVDEFMNIKELRRLKDSNVSSEKLRHYLETNLVPIVTKKIRYTKFRPQFRLFLSHQSKDKPFMRTFENGLKFLGYATWLDEVNMPMGSNLQAALKTSIDECDCLIAWLNDEYMQSDYCKAELLYAKQLGKIVLPFGDYSSISHHFTGELEFLQSQHIYDPAKSSFFEILRRIDDTLFAFEWLAI